LTKLNDSRGEIGGGGVLGDAAILFCMNTKIFLTKMAHLPKFKNNFLGRSTAPCPDTSPVGGDTHGGVSGCSNVAPSALAHPLHKIQNTPLNDSVNENGGRYENSMLRHEVSMAQRVGFLQLTAKK